MAVSNSFKTNTKSTFVEGNKSAGILEDYDIKKVIQTKELKGTTANVTNLSGGYLTVLNDRDGSLSGANLVSNTIFGTSATPPTASDFPTGTIYIQYTA